MVQAEVPSSMVNEDIDASLRLFVDSASSSSNFSKEEELAIGGHQKSTGESEMDRLSANKMREDMIESDVDSMNEISSTAPTVSSSDEDEDQDLNDDSLNPTSKATLEYFDPDKIEEIIESLDTDSAIKNNIYISDNDEDVIIDEDRSTCIRSKPVKSDNPESIRAQKHLQYPVIIKFKKQKYNLFQPEYMTPEIINIPVLLNDKDLYNLPFEEFFPKLRAAFVKIGKPLSIAYEIFLKFQDLNLVLNEDNIYTTEIKLREVIIMFHNVNRNTNKSAMRDDIRVELSLRKRFSTCFNRIIDSIKDGKGFEALHAIPSHTRNEEEPIFIIDDDSNDGEVRNNDNNNNDDDSKNGDNGDSNNNDDDNNINNKNIDNNNNNNYNSNINKYVNNNYKNDNNNSDNKDDNNNTNKYANNNKKNNNNNKKNDNNNSNNKDDENKNDDDNYTPLSANFIKKGKQKVTENDKFDYSSDCEPDKILNFNSLKNMVAGTDVFDKDYYPSESITEYIGSLKHGLIDIDSDDIFDLKKSRNN